MSYPQNATEAISPQQLQLLGHNILFYDLVTNAHLDILRNHQTCLQEWFAAFLKLEGTKLVEEMTEEYVKLHTDVFSKLDTLFDHILFLATTKDATETHALCGIENAFACFSDNLMDEKNCLKRFFMAFIRDFDNRHIYSTMAEHAMAYQTISQLFYAHIYHYQSRKSSAPWLAALQ